ncbi:MAG TPA: alpha-amylase, partial [Trueperaceae bacterium]
DWFIGLDESPYPGYSFSGPDLSSDPRVGIYLEDHYYDGTDAAVVFKRVDHLTGAGRYLYHGNDGTALPWNDTAQLNYLSAEAREAVIQTILHVARKFPIIRFDAAMVLAKVHIERLWFPEPGHGGAIPSRAQYGSMSKREFDRLLPREFWREVVDRVAAEVPDTLLLAEAFWMMEGYFVRTLGMHRVYNSAFMNMLKDEENAKYRQFVKNVLAFDPEILRRFVNFMNNPDEETALAQFGRGDKYFGVCTLLATMPGLPMFGHGQVEGFREKYGMEYRRAKLQEEPDAELLARHQREIFPLLHRRAQFAEVENFLLYDLVSADGQVQEDVFAYSNRVDDQASLVVFHNRYAEASGWIRTAAPFKPPGSEESAELIHRTLQDGLALRAGEQDYLIFRDHTAGLEYLRRSRELVDKGFFVSLGAFKYQVFLDFREVADSADAPYGQLERELAGRGVPSVAGALDDLKLRPLHDALARVLRAGQAPSTTERSPAARTALLQSYRAFLEVAQEYGGAEPTEALVDAFAAAAHTLARPVSPDDVREASPSDQVLLLAWAALQGLEAPGENTAELYHRWHLAGPTREALTQLGPGAARAERLLPLLLRYGNWTEKPSGQAATAEEQLLSELLVDEEALEFLGVHDFEGARWFNREAYRELTRSLVHLALFRARLQGLAVED